MAGCGTVTGSRPCRRRMNGAIMSACSGPGRNSEMAAMTSSKSRSCRRVARLRCPELSSWKRPTVRAERMSL